MPSDPSRPSTAGAPRWSTLSVHAGEPRQKAFDAVTTPIVASATYAFRDNQELTAHFEGTSDREEYGRYGNPTVRAAERKIAVLEGAEDAVLFSSGMAAVTTTLFELLRGGAHVIMTSDCYRRTRQFVLRVLGRYGVESSLVEPGDRRALEAALRPGQTKLVLSESPTNPYLRVADLRMLAAVRDACPGSNLMIDSTFATPVNQRPLALGTDLVMHSGTKYLGGHNDLLAGVVCGRAGLIAAIRDLRGVLGAVLDPHSAFLLLRGLKTLSLRVERHNRNALAVAGFLEAHPRVEKVFYPGLPSHPDHAVAREQMSGFGGVVSFLVRGGAREAGAMVEKCRLATIAPSLGSVDTLIEQPAIMSFYELTTEQREAIGIKDNLVRLAVGIEDVEDIVADLDQALS